MSLQSFIPSVWSNLLLINLHKSLVYGQPQVINRNYEGEIKRQGDQVKINAIGQVQVKAYTKDTPISNPDTLNSTQTTLVISQQDYFNFSVDDIDQVQATPNVMGQAMMEAGYSIAEKADRFIASQYVEVASTNAIGSDASPITFSSPSTAYEALLDLGILLNKANVPLAGRWVILPPDYSALLLRDPRFVSYGTDANRQNLANGQIGRAAGFDILESNNVPNTNSTKYKVIAGSNIAWTYADQITETEAYRHPNYFGDALKGLHVYGAKVVRPNALALLTCNFPTQTY